MPLEFYKSGSDEAPLILMSSSNVDHWVTLHKAIAKLLARESSTVDIHNLSGWEGVEGCKLRAILGQTDRGVRQTGQMYFECCLTPTWWDNNEGLIEGFCRIEDWSRSLQQFLSVPGGDIEWVLSTTHGW